MSNYTMEWNSVHFEINNQLPLTSEMSELDLLPLWTVSVSTFLSSWHAIAITQRNSPIVAEKLV